jgi:hypothetical protein
VLALFADIPADTDRGAGLARPALSLLGVGYHSVAALLAVQSTEALLSGMSWPALTLLFKRGLSEAELPAATCLENVIFASQVLLGTGLGVVLFQKISVFTLLAIDAASFLGSLVMLWLAGRRFSAHHPPSRRGPLRHYAGGVDRSAETQPAHPARAGGRRLAGHGAASGTGPAAPSSGCGGPCFAAAFREELGQLCGPMLLKREPDALCGSHATHHRLPGIFLAAYGCCRFCPGGWYALGMIFIAHLASNVLFAAGRLALSSFHITQTASASGKAWRWQTLSASLFTGIAAAVASGFGSVQALYAVSSAALLMVALIMRRIGNKA